MPDKGIFYIYFKWSVKIKRYFKIYGHCLKRLLYEGGRSTGGPISLYEGGRSRSDSSFLGSC